MYPDTSPTTPVAIDHGLTLLADDQAAARPCRSSEQRPTTVGYGRVSRDPADLRAAVLELHRLGVHSEHTSTSTRSATALTTGSSSLSKH